MKKFLIALALLLTACGSEGHGGSSEASKLDSLGAADVILEPAPWTVTMHWWESEEAVGCDVPDAVEHQQAFAVPEKVLVERQEELFYRYDDCRVDEEKRSVECDGKIPTS